MGVNYNGLLSLMLQDSPDLSGCLAGRLQKNQLLVEFETSYRGMGYMAHRIVAWVRVSFEIHS